MVHFVVGIALTKAAFNKKKFLFHQQKLSDYRPGQALRVPGG
jgi:hypothetical protein